MPVFTEITGASQEYRGSFCEHRFYQIVVCLVLNNLKFSRIYQHFEIAIGEEYKEGQFNT